ncbi:MAG TPA: GNAT family N-acetyltransferase [Verrucomicrobiae bacterium]|nr:GNAT family N-acetyltransferase [Verrucomicrobiae bacterium]
MIAQEAIHPAESVPLSRDCRIERGRGVHWINPLEHSDWDEQIAGRNSGAHSFFHGTAWAKVLTETYGYEPVYFVSGETGAVLPLMEVDSPLTGQRGVALPFTDVCEPLCADRVEFHKLFRNAVELGVARGWKYIEFRGGEPSFNGAAPSLAFYGHSIEIPPDEETFISQLKNPVRRAIRKAEKSGVRVEISRDLEAVKQYYVLHCQSRKRHGLPPQPFSFFRNIHRHALLDGSGMVVLAHWGKVPVAGAMFLHSGDKAIYKFGASDDTFQHLRGNNLVFREAIGWLSRNGFKKLDLGRTSIVNEGLRRFKLGWNADETTIRYYRFCLRQKNFVSMRDEGSGWHNQIFKKLPLSISRIAGEILYRHWA